MSRTINRTINFGTIGTVQNMDLAPWAFVFKKSLVKDPGRFLGDRVTTPDGRSFVYSKSSAACISGQGCEFTDTGVVAITTLSTAQSGGGLAGTQTVEIPAASHAALAKDDLQGGYAIVYNGTDNNVDFLQIVGNDASLINAALVIYLEAGVSQAITTSSKVEVFANPYSALRTGTTDTLAKAGRPAVPVSAASTYFWVQDEGMGWAAPQANVGARGGIGCFWRHDGSLESANTALAVTVPAYDTSQYAGHTVAGTAAGNGPLFKFCN